MMVYRRALHPELFNLRGRRTIRYGDYEVEAWISPPGHVVRFQAGRHCLTETVVEGGDHLPEAGLIHALPCLGEKEYATGFEGSDLGYCTTLQTEVLSESLYQSTYCEIAELCLEDYTLSYKWDDSAGVSCLSVVELQKYKKEMHIQSYHMLGLSGLVLRTQSIFEIL